MITNWFRQVCQETERDVVQGIFRTFFVMQRLVHLHGVRFEGVHVLEWPTLEGEVLLRHCRRESRAGWSGAGQGCRAGAL